jgi:hypothetical protein
MSHDSKRPVQSTTRSDDEDRDDHVARTDEEQLGTSREAAFLQSGVCLER